MSAGTHRVGGGLWSLSIGLTAGLLLVGCGDGADSPALPAQPSGTTPAEAERSIETEPPRKRARSERAASVQAVPADGPARSEQTATSEAGFTSATDSLGVYVGAGNVGGVEQFGAWLGNDLDRALDYVGGSSWSSIESPTWTTSQWAGTGYRLNLGVPMFPDTGGSLQAGASGAYNTHFVKLAENLVADGQAGAIIRPGWEFNLPAFGWYGGDDPRAYAAYFRQVVASMRSVRGQQFAFEWNPALGTGGTPLERAYPGDPYVDYIGLDVYDQSSAPGWRSPKVRWKSAMNQAYGLRWHRDFAAKHGKPMTFPEWGVSARPDGHGGGDNPYFIARMHDWIRANNVAAHYYFDYDAPDGDHALTGGAFPRAAARFRQLFG